MLLRSADRIRRGEDLSTLTKTKRNQMANKKAKEFIKNLTEEDIMEKSTSSDISEDSLNRSSSSYSSSSSSTPSYYGPTPPALTSTQSEITLNKLAISMQDHYAAGGFHPAKPSAVFVNTTDSNQSKSM